jgi:hypothetical protein
MGFSKQVLYALIPILERFQPDCAVDPGRFARGTALRLLAMARHVASTRLVPQANRLGLASHSQAESALEACKFFDDTVMQFALLKSNDLLRGGSNVFQSGKLRA